MLVNYYRVLDKNDKIKYRQNPNPMALQHPARVLICGASGSGKTNVLMNLLLNPNVKIPVERIYLLAKHVDSEGDPLYKLLQEHAAEIEEELFDTTGENHKVLIASNDIHQMPQFIDLDPRLQSILVIDDFLAESAKDMQPLDALIIAARKANCTVIFLAQLLTPVHTVVRSNLTYVIAFNTPKKTEIRQYHSDYASAIPNYEDFARMFNGVTTAPPLNGMKHSLLIDLQNDDEYTRYRQDLCFPVHPSDWEKKTGIKYADEVAAIKKGLKRKPTDFHL